MTRAHEDLARLLDGDTGGRAPSGTGLVLETLTLARSELDAATAARPEFRGALRTRLLAVAAVQPDVPAPARPAALPLLGGLRARRRLAALSGALAGVVALTGVAVAAHRSVPGDVFYAAKRTAEDVRLGVARGGQTERGLRRLQQATTRLAELEVLAQGDRALALVVPERAVLLAAGAAHGHVVGVLDDMDDDVRAGSRLVLDGSLAGGDQAALVVLRDWSVGQAARLGALLPRLGSAVLRAEGSLALVRDVEASAVRLLVTETSPGPLVAGTPAPELGTSDVSGGPAGPGAAGADAAEPAPRRPRTTPLPTSPGDGDGDGDTVVRGPSRRGGDAPVRRSADLPRPGLPRPDLPRADLPRADLPRADLPRPERPRPDLPRPDLPRRGSTSTVPLPRAGAPSPSLLGADPALPLLPAS